MAIGRSPGFSESEARMKSREASESEEGKCRVRRVAEGGCPGTLRSPEPCGEPTMGVKPTNSSYDNTPAAQTSVRRTGGEASGGEVEVGGGGGSLRIGTKQMM